MLYCTHFVKEYFVQIIFFQTCANLSAFLRMLFTKLLLTEGKKNECG
jgi:hypothetical protein